MSNIRSAMTILPELRAGQVITELSAAVHDAIAAVSEHNKDAVVTLKITVAPSSKEKLKEPVIIMRAEVESKLPKEVPDATIFFVDDEGNPTRNANARPQQDLGFTVAGQQQGGG
jgi:hypothetical protein